MTLIILIPLIVAITGAFMFLASPNAKVAELGKLVFLAAAIALMFALSGSQIRIG